MTIFRTAGTALLLLALAGCAPESPDAGREAAGQTMQYLAARRAFADALGQVVATEQGAAYRIVPITGPQYPIGSALDPRNPADVVAPACRLPEPPRINWAPLPEITRERRVTLDASMPEILRRGAAAMGELGVNLQANSTARWSMTDVSQQLSPQTEFQRSISTGDCRAETASRDILFVRGIIYSKEAIESAAFLGAGASGGVQRNGVRIAADSRGGFRIEDATAVARYHIVTLKPAEPPNAAPSPQGVELVRPSTAVLERLAAASRR